MDINVADESLFVDGEKRPFRHPICAEKSKRIKDFIVGGTGNRKGRDTKASPSDYPSL